MFFFHLASSANTRYILQYHSYNTNVNTVQYNIVTEVSPQHEHLTVVCPLHEIAPSGLWVSHRFLPFALIPASPPADPTQRCVPAGVCTLCERSKGLAFSAGTCANTLANMTCWYFSDFQMSAVFGTLCKCVEVRQTKQALWIPLLNNV